MRKFKDSLVLTLILAATAFSEPGRFPQLLRLQGRFTDTKVPLTDTLPVRFSIWDSEDGYGNLLWEDVQNVAVQNDTFQAVLGRSKPLTPSVFSGGDRWVELQLGADAPLRPRHKIPNQYVQPLAPAVAPPTVPATNLPAAAVVPAAPLHKASIIAARVMGVSLRPP